MLDLQGTNSKLWIISFYREQLAKFTKIGLGNKTEHDVLVTEKLLKVTKDRLNKLSVVYDKNLTPQAHKLKQLKLMKLKKYHIN
jgi:hypothetical protein